MGIQGSSLALPGPGSASHQENRSPAERFRFQGGWNPQGFFRQTIWPGTNIATHWPTNMFRGHISFLKSIYWLNPQRWNVGDPTTQFLWNLPLHRPSTLLVSPGMMPHRWFPRPERHQSSYIPWSSRMGNVGEGCSNKHPFWISQLYLSIIVNLVV